MDAKVIPIRRKAIEDGIKDVNDLIEGLGFDPHEYDGLTVDQILDVLSIKYKDFPGSDNKRANDLIAGLGFDPHDDRLTVEEILSEFYRKYKNSPGSNPS